MQCVSCGSEFESPTGRGTCSADCLLAAKRRAGLVGNASQSSGAVCTCVECGEVFTSPRRRVRCSKRCENMGYWHRRKERTVATGECVVCGETYERHVSWPRATKVCSQRCGSIRGAPRREHARPTFWISGRTRQAIYERDGATCQLCLELVDLTLPSSDLWGPTLDHIVPQSKGGTHDETNLRLAHRWCNCVRGNDTYHTVDDLRVTL
jgi:5-methylcytosine-specific restriction endonuclease McrA